MSWYEGTRARAQGSAIHYAWAQGDEVLTDQKDAMGILCAGLGAGAVTGPRRGHQAAWAGRQST
eukprot:2055481-Prymnesium_polylepis.3